MTDQYLMPALPEIREFFNEIAADMTLETGVSFAEAVARINQQWRDLEFLDRNEIILHDGAHYWAMHIYYTDVPDWSPDADRSGWKIGPAPAPDSGCWTLGPA